MDESEFREVDLHTHCRIHAGLRKLLVARRLFHIDHVTDLDIPVFSESIPKEKLHGPELTEIIRRVAKLEDRIILSGEVEGFPHFGKTGLSTAKGRTTHTASGPWPLNFFDDMKEIIEYGNENQFVGGTLVVSDAIYGLLQRNLWNDQIPDNRFAMDPTTTYIQYALDMGIINRIEHSPQLMAEDGGYDSAIYIAPYRDVATIELTLGLDMKAMEYTIKDKETNEYKTYVELKNAPRLTVHKPSCIIEITDIPVNPTIS